MALVNIYTVMEINILEIGKKIKNQGKEYWQCRQEIFTKVAGLMVKNKEKVFITLGIQMYTMAILKVEQDKVMVNINGMIIVTMMDNGKMTKWMGKESIVIVMVKLLEESLRMIILLRLLIIIDRYLFSNNVK